MLTNLVLSGTYNEQAIYDKLFIVKDAKESKLGPEDVLDQLGQLASIQDEISIDNENSAC